MRSRVRPFGGEWRRQLRLVAWFIGWSIAVGSAGAQAADASHPIVVELFQSQGCSSCPPANANVNALSQRADVVALSFSVTYWDSLGWKDTFAKSQFTDRQWQYARAMHQANVYTPQVVVNGRIEGVGADRGEIEALMSRANQAATGPTVTISGESVEIGAGSAPSQIADVWLVHYDPRTLEVPVLRGENAGKTLPHRNIVREMVRLGDWSGQAERFSLPADGSGLGTAILVQTYGAGPILAAAKGELAKTAPLKNRTVPPSLEQCQTPSSDTLGVP